MNKAISRLVAVAAVALMAFTASARYLYCMIENANNIYNGEAIQFDFATVSIDGGASYLYFSVPNNQGASGQQLIYSDASKVSTATGAYAMFDDDTPEYTTFLFELFTSSDSKDSRVAWQQYSLSSLMAANAIGSATDTSEITLFKVSQVIPEPTSGILLLLGMAGLALRRRRA